MLTLQNLRWSGKQLLSAILQILQHNLRSGWTRAFGPRNSARYFGLLPPQPFPNPQGRFVKKRCSWWAEQTCSTVQLPGVSLGMNFAMIPYIPQKFYMSDNEKKHGSLTFTAVPPFFSFWAPPSAPSPPPPFPPFPLAPPLAPPPPLFLGIL